jgi:hypothetical protein
VNRVAPIVGLASHLGRGVQRIATDAIVGRVRSLPRTVEDLDAKSLSQIMGRTVTYRSRSSAATRAQHREPGWH